MGRRGCGWPVVFVALVLALIAAAPAQAASAPALPLGFEPLGAAGHFGARAPGGAAAIAPGSAVIAGRGARPVRMRPLGARTKVRTRTGRRLPGVVNRLTGARSQWRTGIPLFASVRQHGVYRGVDLVFHTRKGALEYDFVVRPGASPRRIRFAVDGARRLRLGRHGDLIIRTRGGTLRHRRPVAYQRAGGRRVAVRARFVLLGKRRVAFRIGAYDRSRPLVIDPVLAFSGYVGGSGDDEGTDVATDADGNTYVTGRTTSYDFPALAGADMGCGTDGACNPTLSEVDGRSDAFVAKLDTAGRLVWATYIGGTAYDQAGEIALGPGGRITISGTTTSRDFPVTAGAYRATWPYCDGECYSTYVLRLAPDGRSLDWATLFTNDFLDTRIEDLAVDGTGDVVLVGATETSSFPATLGALGAASRRVPDFWGDAFVTKLDTSGSRLDWSGEFGGGDEDGALAVAIAPAGDIVIGGRTRSTDFFTTPGAPQQRCDGPGRPADYGGCDMDGFVTRVPADGTVPSYSTFLGGNGWDLISAIAVDPDGRPIVGGTTSAADFPATQSLTLSSQRLFAARLPAAGGPPEWASLVAGGDGVVSAVAPGGRGDVYVAGSTQNLDAIAPVDAYQGVNNGGLEGFAMRVASGGASARWATYLGGGSWDAVTGLAAGPRGVVLSGTTLSSDFPTRSTDAALGDGTCRLAYGCPGDAFAARIVEGTTAPAYDDFSRRRVLQAASGYAYVDASAATAEAGEPAHAGQPAAHSVWFDWTAPADRTITLDTRNSGFDTVLAVYRGRTFATLAPVAANDDAPGRTTSRLSFTAVRGRTYRIAVDGKAGAAGLARLQWEGSPPANDDFLAAQPIAGTSGSVTGNDVYATAETGEPPGDGDPPASVWYRWTAPSTGVYRLSTAGSEMESLTDVFHGQRVELLDHLAWDVLNAKAGATYWIRVRGYRNGAGDVKLSWRKVPRPANDDLAGATPITTAEGSASGETYAATMEIGEPSHGGPRGTSVWYRWTPPAPGSYELTLDVPDWRDALFVYTGSGYGDLTGLIGGTRFAQLGFEPGESVLIAIDTLGDYKISWRRLAAPANDMFSQAKALTGAGGEEPAVTSDSTMQPGEPSGYRGVWYRWTAPSSGPATFQLLDASSSGGLNVFTGSAIRALTPAGTTDPSTPKVTFDAVAGTTYRIRVAGGDGARALAWAAGRPANDDFASAQAITGASGTTAFPSAHATPQTGEPGSPYEGSTWFNWTAPASGAATFTTASGRSDLPVDVFTGSQLTALTQVATASYDQAARGYVVRFTAVAGTTYRVRVRGSSLGTQQLTWNRAATESEAPFMQIVSFPAPGEHLRGQGYFEVATIDRRGVDRVDLLAGTTVVRSATLGYYGSFSSTWETTTLPDGPVTLTLRAVDRYGNATTSAPVGVVIDNTAPQTRIVTGPAASTSSRTAAFSFSAGEAAQSWTCRLDHYGWLPCGTTLTIAKLADGPHALEVRATDLAGNVDLAPARWAWTVTGAEAQPVAAAPVSGPAAGRPPAAPAPAAPGSPAPASSQIAVSREAKLQLSVALAGSRVTVARLRRGLRIAAGCSRACALRARLQLLGRGKRTIARAALRARAGRTATVKLRVSRTRAAKLPSRARLRLVVGAAASGATASVRRPLMLRR